MARRAVINDDTHREEQAEYRVRLVQEDRPEVGRVDTAVAVAVYALLRKIKEEQRDRDGKADLDFILESALDAVVEMGRERKERSVPFDRKASRRVLRRRLVRQSDRFDRLLGQDDESDDAHLVSLS
ncbi:hypothetical protein [Mesorhizobium sp. A556]